jgi:glycosyltransferase involved in cell wall biosynthesis
MDISVVIPSKDSPGLAAALRSLESSALSHPKLSIEVVVVDSSDQLPPIISGSSDRFDLRVIHKKLTLLEARIEGIEAARGDNILNLDSDQTIHPDLLPALIDAKAASVIIPELPTGPGRLSELVRRKNERALAEFRRRPSLIIPVIPRRYRREPLMKAIVSLRRQAPEQVPRHLPTRHEDTILFAYFLNANGWTERECVGFVDTPIYHPVTGFSETARKYYRYGRDMGAESRMLLRGEMALNPGIWSYVYRVDLGRMLTYWDSDFGWNMSGFVYDFLRAPFYSVGVVLGFVKDPRRG